MPSINDDRNALWDLLAEAFRVGLLRLGREQERQFNALVTSSPHRMPDRLEKDNTIFVFWITGIAGKSFRICFNPSLATDRETEYFNRGCTLIRELLNIIFGRYNVLLVQDVRYNDKPKVDFSRFARGNYSFKSSESSVRTKNVGENFRYRVGFWVTVKDQIDKRVTNKVFALDLPVELTNGRVEYRTDMQFEIGEETNSTSRYYPISDVSADAKEAVVQLAATLQSEEQKEKIFDLFRSLQGKGLKEYLDERIEHAKNMADSGDPVFRYNVVPLTIYLDRVRYMSYTYTFRQGRMSADFSFDLDPTKPLTSVRCPHCGREITSAGDRIILALKDKTTPVIACTGCTTDLSSSGYYSATEYQVYLSENVVKADHNGKQIDLFRDDAFVSALDGKRYSKKSGDKAQFYFKNAELHAAAETQLFPASQLHSCPNCRRKYALLPADTKMFEEKCFIHPVDDSITACRNCMDVPKPTASFSPNKEVYLSERRGGSPLQEIFFTMTFSARVCSVCGKAVYYKQWGDRKLNQATTCSICRRYVCTEKECMDNGICKNCMSVLRTFRMRMEDVKAPM